MAIPSPVIFGCAGLSLSPEERAFFTEVNPFGFILFQRNCGDAAQIRALCADLRACCPDHHAPILIDQEGGRVARLKGAGWPKWPPGAVWGRLYAKDKKAAREGVWLHGRLLADTLLPMGIDVDCWPLCDVPVPGAHDVIGDRAFAEDTQIVADLASEACAGLQAGGVDPVIKHIPGHGRAGVDSHKELPVVDTPIEALELSDFGPFVAAGQAPFAMTAHVVYTDLDPDQPATCSPRVIDQIIRGWMGYDGLLMSDDLSMQALQGDMGTRTRAAQQAGCDLILHCNGEMPEMRAVVDRLAPPIGSTGQRITSYLGQRRPEPQSFDSEAGWSRLQALVELAG